MHDAYARRTPYELAFPDEETARERFGSIRENAVERGEEAALADPGRFLALPRAAEILHEIRDPRAEPEKAHQHGVLLYHAFHFAEAGRPLFLLGTHAARYLVESAPSPPGEDGRLGPPEPAGYLQLPRHLFWTRPAEDGPPEPVDGIFWSAPGGDRIAVLLAAGLREDRPGLSVVPLPAVPLSDAPTWLETRIRSGERDFESTLPGGELDRLYSLEAAGEVLKLLARLFRYLELFPDAVTPHPGRSPDGEEAEREPEEAAGAEPPLAEQGTGAAESGPEEAGALPQRAPGEGPPPSALPYRRIELDGGDGDGEGASDAEESNRDTET